MRYYVADAHNDFLYGNVIDGYDIKKISSKRQVTSIEKLKAGNVALQFFAAWIDRDINEDGFTQFCSLSSAYHRLLKENDELVQATPDFVPESGKIATVLTVEGGEAISGDISRLQYLREQGVRAMTLTWNTQNELGYPATGWRNKGLTVLGKRAVAELNRLNIAVDVAHLSDAGIDDVLSYTKAPVFSSHTNCRGIYSSSRNLKKEHIREIAGKGGVICVNFYNKQLGSKKIATTEDIVSHIEYILDTGGENSAAIGSDFEGMGVYPSDLKDAAEFPNLIERMKKHGFTENIIRKVMFDNLFNYIRRFL